MNRRSFVIGLFGGIAATGLGGAAIAREAAATSLDAATGELAPAVKAGLDQADADFSQVVVRERVVRRRRRPVVTRRVIVRRRGPVVTRRVIVRRPRRVVRRRVIVR